MAILTCQNHDWGYVPGTTPDPTFSNSFFTCLRCGHTGWRSATGKDRRIKAFKGKAPDSPIRWGREYERRVKEERDMKERHQREDKEDLYDDVA